MSLPFRVNACPWRPSAQVTTFVPSPAFVLTSGNTGQYYPAHALAVEARLMHVMQQTTSALGIGSAATVQTRPRARAVPMIDPRTKEAIVMEIPAAHRKSSSIAIVDPKTCRAITDVEQLKEPSSEAPQPPAATLRALHLDYLDSSCGMGVALHCVSLLSLGAPHA